MKEHLKTGTTVITKYVDRETGEILDQEIETSKYLAGSKDEFFLMYSAMINVLKGCNDPEIILLAGLIERYSSGQSFAMTQHLKDEIGVGVNCSVLSFNRAFTELKRANIIVEPKSRLYKINPRFVFKGSSNNRGKHLKVVLEYCKEC